jgi:hypothetical protein
VTISRIITSEGHAARMATKEMNTKFCWGNTAWITYDTHERIILNKTGEWAGSICLRIGINGRIL